jgi:hypothetical protein
VALKRGFAPVAFDELAWQDDLRKAGKSARRIGEETRSRLEREGQAVDALFACHEDARDGTKLPGCVKVYAKAVRRRERLISRGTSRAFGAALEWAAESLALSNLSRARMTPNRRKRLSRAFSSNPPR